MSLSVIREQSHELKYHVETFHYLHRWPNALSMPFGYALLIDGKRHAPDGRMWGLVVMKKPQHHRQRDLFGFPGLPTAWQVLDLARVWIHPCLQGESATEFFTNRAGLQVPRNANVFSQMVGKVLRHVQSDWLEHHPPRFPDLPYHITTIISYCQLEHHDGTGYRASGFRSTGLSRDCSKELYVRQLAVPRKSWRAPLTIASTQISLFE